MNASAGDVAVLLAVRKVSTSTGEVVALLLDALAAHHRDDDEPLGECPDCGELAPALEAALDQFQAAGAELARMLEGLRA